MMKQSMSTSGAIFIVAGTTIGAAMLGGPLVSYSVGIMCSIAIMLALWLIMFLASIVSIDLTIQHGSPITIPKLAGKTLGKFAETISALSLLCLLFALLAAYMSGTVSILFKEFQINKNLIAILLACALGILLYSHIKIADYVNRVILVIKVLVFGAILYVFLPHIDYNAVADIDISSAQKNYTTILLVFFTAFGFHGSIPSIIRYAGLDRSRLIKIFLIGSLIPLVVYVLWQFVCLGVIYTIGNNALDVINNNNDLGVFIGAVNNVIQNPSLQKLLDTFVLLAIFTSYLGVAISLADYLLELLGRGKNKFNQPLAVLLTTSVPLAIYMLYPNGFIMALKFAAVFLSILAIIMPCLIALKLKHKNSILLYPLLAFGLLIVFIQLLL